MKPEKRTLTVGTFVSAALLASSISYAQKPEPTEVSGKIDWVFDYEEAKRISHETERPMWVVFRCER